MMTFAVPSCFFFQGLSFILPLFIQVLFPSGVKVEVYRNDFGLNINLYTPRAKQKVNESGLCLYDEQVQPDVNQYGYRFR